MRTLTREDLFKLASSFGLDVNQLLKTNELGILDYAAVRNLLIKIDFSQYTDANEDCKISDITQYIAEKRGVSKSKVESVVYGVKKRVQKRLDLCIICGSAIGAAECSKNYGVCNNCKEKPL